MLDYWVLQSQSSLTTGYMSHDWIHVTLLGTCHTTGYLSHYWVHIKTTEFLDCKGRNDRMGWTGSAGRSHSNVNRCMHRPKKESQMVGTGYTY